MIYYLKQPILILKIIKHDCLRLNVVKMLKLALAHFLTAINKCRASH